jgi:5'-3' exonuclease
MSEFNKFEFNKLKSPDVLLFDLSNMLYHSAHRLYRGFDRRPDATSLILNAAEEHMRTIYRQFRPDSFFFACDDSTYWRKELFPDYKAQRLETPMKLLVRRAAEEFKTKHAKYCIQVASAEADDVIYVATQILKGVKVIVSTDRDFLQVVSGEVKLFNPMSNGFRHNEHSREFSLFMKCIRGDSSDNIPSAYPRVTEKRLKKAFGCADELALLLSNVLPDKTLVKTHYERNRILVDFVHIPSDIQKNIQESLQRSIQEKSVKGMENL